MPNQNTKNSLSPLQTMTSLPQVQQDIAALPPEAQQIIFDLVDVLKNRYQTQKSTPAQSSINTYQQFLDSGLIGCIEIEENLSTTYKQVLAEGWAKKYDHC